MNETDLPLHINRNMEFIHIELKLNTQLDSRAARKKKGVLLSSSIELLLYDPPLAFWSHPRPLINERSLNDYIRFD